MNKNDSNNTSRTNWQALAQMSDDSIDYSDIPPLTDEFFDRAILRIPAAQAQNLIHLDPDVKISINVIKHLSDRSVDKIDLYPVRERIITQVKSEVLDRL